MRWPSGAHEMGLATSVMNSLGVPPRNGTRQIVPRRAGRLTHEVDRGAIGRKRGAEERHASARVATICTLLVVVVWRIHRL